jgi:hypothetical protein
LAPAWQFDRIATLGLDAEAHLGKTGTGFRIKMRKIRKPVCFERLRQDLLLSAIECPDTGSGRSVIAGGEDRI